MRPEEQWECAGICLVPQQVSAPWRLHVWPVEGAVTGKINAFSHIQGINAERNLGQNRRVSWNMWEEWKVWIYTQNSISFPQSVLKNFTSFHNEHPPSLPNCCSVFSTFYLSGRSSLSLLIQQMHVPLCWSTKETPSSHLKFSVISRHVTHSAANSSATFCHIKSFFTHAEEESPSANVRVPVCACARRNVCVGLWAQLCVRVTICVWEWVGVCYCLVSKSVQLMSIWARRNKRSRGSVWDKAWVSVLWSGGKRAEGRRTGFEVAGGQETGVPLRPFPLWHLPF